MRAFVRFSSLLVLSSLILASRAVAADAAPGRLESVRILAAGANSSLAVQTSTSVALIATTAADARTVVIELVGISADRHDLAVADHAGMISHIAIDTVGVREGRAITRIRVSLSTPYRHRVRVSGNLTYVDFERRAAGDVAVVARQAPNTPKRAPKLPALNSPARPAPTTATNVPPPADTGVPEPEPIRLSPETALLTRSLAITEWLQHASTPIPGAPGAGRAWIPVVLTDGAVIYAYGDYTELDEHFLFLLPFDDSNAPAAQAVSLPTSVVNLDATRLAAQSIRAGRYALTSGPADFRQLGEEVTTILNEVPSQPNPTARVNLAEMARRRLNEWPAAHYGYRAREIHEAVGMLDDILDQLRAVPGVKRFDLSLVTPAPATPANVPVRQPALLDLLENAMRLVSRLRVAAERTAVLRATADALERHHGELPAIWFATSKRRVTAALESETRVDEAYRKLAADMINNAVRAAGKGDVRAVSALQLELGERDRRLGGKRPETLFAITVALQEQFTRAAQVRLLDDQQTMRLAMLQAYANGVELALKRFDLLKPELQRISNGSTESDLSKLVSLRKTIDVITRALSTSPPPPEVTQAHGLLVTAAQLAGIAADEAVSAIALRQTEAAARARGAATTSLTTFERGRRALEASRRPSTDR